MWLVLIPVAAVAGVLGLTAYVRKKEGTGTQTITVVPAAQAAMNVFADGVLRLASNNVQIMPQPAERQQLAAMATQYGLPKTAQALISGGAWPHDELWPGTATPVDVQVGTLWAHSQYNPQRVA
jgi:hypothetical protein